MKKALSTSAKVAPRSDSKVKAKAKIVASRVQMVDIARLAGVSAATVSRALSGNSMIPEATRKRVEDVARMHGYQVNHSAANLRKGNSRTVGVVVLADEDQPLSDPFILGMVGQIADALNARGQSLLLTRLQKHHRQSMTALVESGQVGGLLVIGQAKYHAELNALEAAGLPIVVWGAVLPDAIYSTVGGDNLQGGYLATRHLLEQGARRIAFIGDTKHPEVKLRHKGYLKAHKEWGVKPDKVLVSSSLFSKVAIDNAIEGWLALQGGLDAVFASSDVAAANVIAALGARRVAVPQQVRVVGYDDVLLSAYLHPSLTTVRQPIDLAAQRMLELLAQKMQGDSSRAEMVPTHLVVRESSQ